GSGAPYPCYGLSTTQMRQWIRDFVDEVRARTGREAMIYTNRNWWDPCTGSSGDFSANPLFTANYSSSPGQLPAGWSNWTLWQFADAGRFPGDQDVFNGDEAALAAFVGGGATIGPQAFRRRFVGSASVIGQVCGRASDALYCATLDRQGNVTVTQGPPLGDPNGWGDPREYTTIQVAAVNGSDKADPCARASDGFYCWLAGGTGFPTQIAGPALSDGNGWGEPRYYTTIQFADVNGDGKDDVCARASDGFYCWLAGGTGFPTQIAGPALSDGNGWGEPKYYATIQLDGSVGDGNAALCGRHTHGCYWCRSSVARL